MTLRQLRLDNAGSRTLRFHPIDWDARNIPVQRKDLIWVQYRIA